MRQGALFLPSPALTSSLGASDLLLGDTCLSVLGGITCQKEFPPTGQLTTVLHHGASMVAGSFVDKRLLWQQGLLRSPQAGSALPDSAHWLEHCHQKLQDRPRETQRRTVSSSKDSAWWSCLLSLLFDIKLQNTHQSVSCVFLQFAGGTMAVRQGCWPCADPPIPDACNGLSPVKSHLVLSLPTMSPKDPGRKHHTASHTAKGGAGRGAGGADL